MFIRIPGESVAQLTSGFKVTGVLPIAIMALALQGCGSDPDSRSLLTVTQPTAGYAIVDESNGSGGGDASTPGTGTSGGSIVSTQVSASGGGQMVCGRHTLTIPPGALKSDEQLTLVDLTSVRGYPCAQILPDNVHFKGTVVLTTEVSDLQDPQTSTMYWLHVNPRGRLIWSSVGGSISPSGTAIVASLGKAGVFAVTTPS